MIGFKSQDVEDHYLAWAKRHSRTFVPCESAVKPETVANDRIVQLWVSLREMVDRFAVEMAIVSGMKNAEKQGCEGCQDCSLLWLPSGETRHFYKKPSLWRSLFSIGLMMNNSWNVFSKAIFSFLQNEMRKSASGRSNLNLQTEQILKKLLRESIKNEEILYEMIFRKSYDFFEFC